jgi:hypothetical protein
MVKKSAFDDAGKKQQQKHPLPFFEDFFYQVGT